MSTDRQDHDEDGLDLLGPLARSLRAARLAREAKALDEAPGPHAGPDRLRLGHPYRVPGLDGLWRIMGLETVDMAADGTARLDIVRDDGPLEDTDGR